jgi:type II secretory pathway pseudopilin PulG
MRDGTGLRGYTIIEVMIFLAVSGLMFIVAATFISGKQARSEFQQGINDINTEVQQVINDVSNGFYPSNSDFTCVSNAGGLVINTGNNTQGSNGGTSSSGNGCVFLGKVMQFGNSTIPATNYYVYTVAGSQYTSGGSGPNTPTNFTQALPTAIDTDTPNPSIRVGLTENDTLTWGLQVDKITDTDPILGLLNLTSIGFYGSFGSYNASNNLVSGAQATTVVGYKGIVGNSTTPSANDTQADLVNYIHTTDDGSNSIILANPDILICLSGPTNQYGSLTIGGSSGQRLATSIQISQGSPPPGC